MNATASTARQSSERRTHLTLHVKRRGSDATDNRHPCVSTGTTPSRRVVRGFPDTSAVPTTAALRSVGLRFPTTTAGIFTASCDCHRRHRRGRDSTSISSMRLSHQAPSSRTCPRGRSSTLNNADFVSTNIDDRPTHAHVNLSPSLPMSDVALSEFADLVCV